RRPCCGRLQPLQARRYGRIPLLELLLQARILRFEVGQLPLLVLEFVQEHWRQLLSLRAWQLPWTLLGLVLPTLPAVDHTSYLRNGTQHLCDPTRPVHQGLPPLLWDHDICRPHGIVGQKNHPWAEGGIVPLQQGVERVPVALRSIQGTENHL